MRTVKRIVRLHHMEGYMIHCLFNNGESRIIDFGKLFKEWEVQPQDLEYSLTQSIEEFQQVELMDGTLGWKNIRISSTDEDGNPMECYYQPDPIVLYEASEPDPSRMLAIGRMIRQTRKELGLTQDELAARSGTSKHYISRIENEKSGIELSTLIKIVEGGLGKKIQINIV